MLRDKLKKNVARIIGPSLSRSLLYKVICTRIDFALCFFFSQLELTSLLQAQ